MTEAVLLKEIDGWNADPSDMQPEYTGDIWVNPEFVLSVSDHLGQTRIQFITGFNVSIQGQPEEVKRKLWG